MISVNSLRKPAVDLEQRRLALVPVLNVAPPSVEFNNDEGNQRMFQLSSTK